MIKWCCSMNPVIERLRGSGRFSFSLLVVVGALVLAVHGFSITRYPAVGGDEVPASATAYNLVARGEFARSIHPGPAGFHLRDYFPPMPPLLIAISYWIFGFGVWQTKLVPLICGLATAGLVFLLANRLVPTRRSVLAATLSYVLNPLAFLTWHEARNEALFTLVIAAMLYLGYSTLTIPVGRRQQTWCLIGVVTGIMILTYYPFAPLGGLVILPFLWAGIHQDRRSTVFGFGVGLLPVLGVFIAHVLVDPHMFYTQMLGHLQHCYSATSGFAQVWTSFLAEGGRYRAYATRLLAVPELLMGACVIVGLPRLARKYPREWAALWIPLVLWLGVLSFHRTKELHYLAAPSLFVAVGVAILDREIIAQSRRSVGHLWNALLAGMLMIGLIRIAAISYTTAYQWRGRDYGAFTAAVRHVIPEHASVVGPQPAWSAWGDRPASPRLYTWGGIRRGGPTGELELNDPASLRTVTHIMLQGELLGQQGRLPGLREYVQAHCKISETIRLPFAPLPWARQSPFDMEIYECRSVDNRQR